MVSNKYAFWQALVFTIIIFGVGILLGFVLEGTRSDTIELTLLNSEINLLDHQLRNQEKANLNISCETSIQNTFEFADKIFNEARKLEKIDQANKFTEILKVLHKRYDLLRIMLWMESIDVKERCQADFHTVVYFYHYGTEDIAIQAEQAALSRLLLDLKDKHGNKIVLIPIAVNLDLESTNLLIEKYKITKLPAIIIDEQKVIEDKPTIEELENITFNIHK